VEPGGPNLKRILLKAIKGPTIGLLVCLHLPRNDPPKFNPFIQLREAMPYFKCGVPLRKKESFLAAGHLQSYNEISTIIQRWIGSAFDIGLKDPWVPCSEKGTLCERLESLLPGDEIRIAARRKRR
jgi:hypothetical protein